MSAIRPPLTSPLFPTQPAPAPAPARAARASFFQAALDRLAPLPEEAPAAAPEPAAVAASVAADRPSRPGSLLDIRV